MDQRNTAQTKNQLSADIRLRLIELEHQNLSLDTRIELAQDIASSLLCLASQMQTRGEKRQEKLLAKMIQDVQGKALISSMIDSAFRTNSSPRLVLQVQKLLAQFGMPQFLPRHYKWLFASFCKAGHWLPQLFTSLIKQFIYQRVRQVIAPGETEALNRQLKSWKKLGVKINLNRLGEAILGENEATHRFEENLTDLANPLIEVISVKISSIFSQINLLAWKDTLKHLKERLRLLFRQAQKEHKFVTLDMEEYKDLHLTVQLFQEVLNEPEFLHFSAGIALQSYLPDSFQLLECLTNWALIRRQMGGAPIKVRIVKGANLGMERVEASLKGWPQAPYLKKADTDANFKKMLHYAIRLPRLDAVHLGIGSHNLFDIAYACVLAAEQKAKETVTIEMLAGMAPHIARAISSVWDNVLLYLPAAKKEEFHTAMAYLMRRLDENTARENFLTHLFDLQTSSQSLQEQKELFRIACLESNTLQNTARRTQDRNRLSHKTHPPNSFTNEPDTDFSLAQNRSWASDIIRSWQVSYHEVPLMIQGRPTTSRNLAQGIDPSRPECKIHTYFLADDHHVEEALSSAKEQAPEWAKIPVSKRAELLREVANILRQDRKRLIGAMMQEAGKIISEADSEVSEAIDFAEYYAKEAESFAHADKLFSVGKVALVATPWNFPLAIPCSAIASSLMTGHSVIFKPAPEAVLSGYFLAQAFWQAGIPTDVLQFITCTDHPLGTKLVCDLRIDKVILTGSTQTAKYFLEKRPNLALFAETGGKNSIIVTALSDRDLAVKDIVHSAFGYAGQKCSACSLLILEEEVYHSQNFRQQLVDASSHLVVGSSYHPKTMVNPLIRPASAHLLRALTSLEEGEEWLLQPRQDPENPQLWSPGIKLGVQPGSFTHQTEFFGPLLGVMCAKNLAEAITFANSTPYGLTAGIHSLDAEEQTIWKNSIMAGNCYINRAITGALVGRQPFGGCKASSFGLGMKVGGPNYLIQFGDSYKIPPLGQHDPDPQILALEIALRELGAKQHDLDRFYKGISSMTFWWNTYFSQTRTLRRLVGQDNFIEFRPQPELFLYIQESDLSVDIMLVLAGAKICGCRVTCGSAFRQHRRLFRDGPLAKFFNEFDWLQMPKEEFLQELQKQQFAHLRVLEALDNEMLDSIRGHISILDIQKPSLNGRFELIHYLREVAISKDYHRYGNLMNRDGEMREKIR